MDLVGAVGHTGDSVDVAGAEFASFRRPGRGIMDDLYDESGIGDQTGVESWLRWDLDEIEDSVDRRGGDVALYRALQRTGFKGARQNEFEDVLAKYGLAVIAAWMVRGCTGERWEVELPIDMRHVGDQKYSGARSVTIGSSLASSMS